MPQNNPPATLLERLNAREESAIEELYRTSFSACKMVVLTDGGSMDDAREVFQEAIFSLITRLLRDQDFRLRTNVTGYLKASCRYLWADAVRKGRRTAPIPIRDIQDENDDLQQKRENEQHYQRMYACLKALSPACRQVLELTFFAKEKDAAIAEKMDYSRQFVKNKRRRCMQSLRKCMEKE